MSVGEKKILKKYPKKISKTNTNKIPQLFSNDLGYHTILISYLSEPQFVNRALIEPPGSQ